MTATRIESHLAPYLRLAADKAYCVVQVEPKGLAAKFASARPIFADMILTQVGGGPCTVTPLSGRLVCFLRVIGTLHIKSLSSLHVVLPPLSLWAGVVLTRGAPPDSGLPACLPDPGREGVRGQPPLPCP